MVTVKRLLGNVAVVAINFSRNELLDVILGKMCEDSIHHELVFIEISLSLVSSKSIYLLSFSGKFAQHETTNKNNGNWGMCISLNMELGAIFL